MLKQLEKLKITDKVFIFVTININSVMNVLKGLHSEFLLML